MIHEQGFKGSMRTVFILSNLELNSRTKVLVKVVLSEKVLNILQIIKFFIFKRQKNQPADVQQK